MYLSKEFQEQMSGSVESDGGGQKRDRSDGGGQKRDHNDQNDQKRDHNDHNDQKRDHNDHNDQKRNHIVDNNQHNGISNDNNQKSDLPLDNDLHTDHSNDNDPSLKRTYPDQMEECNPFEDDASVTSVDHKEVKNLGYMGVSPTKPVIRVSIRKYTNELLFDNPNHTVELDPSCYG